MAALAPMPSASVRTTVIANPGVRMSAKNATLRSRRNDIFLPPSVTKIKISPGTPPRTPALPSDAQHGANVLQASGWDCACTLVIDDNDAFRGDCAFRHLESRRDRAIGEQSFSTAQRYRKYLQPERIDQIMLEERLNEICASINVQIWPFLLLNFGDFFRNISV